MKQYIAVTAALLKKDGKYLIAQRKVGDSLAGLWEFPGGKVEQGETPEQCLERELREEFGVKTKVKKFVAQSEYQYPHIAIRLLAYETEYISGAFQLHDHQAIAWVTVEELRNYKFAPADVPIVNHVCELVSEGKVEN